MAGKQFKDLDLKDAFLFAAALQDAETCQMILEIILGKKLPKVNVHVEHSILYSSDLRSIRLDVYASDAAEVTYDVEMENWDKKSLPKRSRYHQAEMDATALEPGFDFTDLKPSYVIFICTFDPFDKGLYRYRFENRCLERDFSLGDETFRIFLNTRGNNDREVPKLLVDFLHYVEKSNDEYVGTVSQEKIEQLHDKIRKLKESREWEARYMTFERLLQKSEEKGREEGLKEGRQEGQQKILKVMECMIASGEAEKIPELTKDETFLEQMLKKYNL